ncbi:hypothetical protein HanHA300_Chr07g0247271 [Helianthus annuus]|nr:hypothetical protein HanHA300_Chr07g0247271 [Helianthus annuus]KAJ0728899.1 hypothetical protein HanLR1_Chr07g0246911 [Helianthus annuus]KAJ0905201.1 hypothetical protein HanPSC8_Chr07g0291251 [Helianthus annuus]
MASYFSSLMLAAREAMGNELWRLTLKRRQMAIEDTILIVDLLIVETYMMTVPKLSLLMVFGRYALKLVVRSSFLFLLQSHKIRSTWRCLIRVKTGWTIPSVFL